MQTPSHDIAWARRLKFRHLETFLVLTESGSLTQAAVSMHMTQSAVSHWLSDLEEAIGVTLLTRGRKLQLTPAGEILKDHALRILGDLRRTQADLQSAAIGAARQLRVGSIHSGLMTLLPDAIHQFRGMAPNVSIRVTDAPFMQLLDALQRRDIDLAILPLDERMHGVNFQSEVLIEDTMEVVVGRMHPLAMQTDVSWKSLEPYPWIAPPANTLMRRRLEKALLDAGLMLRAHIETSSIPLIQALLEESNDVAALAGQVARRLHHQGLVHRLRLHTPRNFGVIGLVWDDGESNDMRRSFIDVLRHVVKQKSGEEFVF
ncbi:LysR substrate-binding domain-containing protein [Cupriavidus basilensis]|uniref:LysR substrate-binding domain-containing protein n=1 Tax=Cupriavidus basilensis TaxID=68895 RepID=A0ABT6B0P3_9BURK|nr:LysR substrate-binding domain-containing protein [Cupriavidus basilensis]MDF3838459.1 LysR substrate-binding domain-containing protein [Cupriavidus basilensis]